MTGSRFVTLGLSAALGALGVLAMAADGGTGSKSGLPGMPSTGEGSPTDGSSLVRPALIAEASALVPGRENWIAVRFDIEPHWHTYWRNAGESGVPPVFTFDAPEWITIGDPVWPTPIRQTVPSGGVDYVYEGRALMLFPVRIDDTTREIKSTADISVKIDWLVCREKCLGGGGQASLSIPISPDASPSPEASEFAAARARLPERDTRGELSATVAGDTLTITPAASVVELEFFPYESALIASPVDAWAQGIARTGPIRFAYDREVAGVEAIEGVVRLRGADGRDRFLEIRAVVPEAKDD